MRNNQEALRRLPLFADLPAPDLEALCRTARDVHAAAGQVIMAEGEAGDGLYIVLGGELEVLKQGGDDQEVVLAVRGAGEFLGEMALLESSTRTATVRAVRESHLLLVEPAGFQELLGRSPTAANTILKTVLARLRSTEAALMQREKLASLGTLAAGLAHELNNPAAAIRRASEQLRDAFQAWQRQTAELGTLSLGPEQARQLERLESEVTHCGEASSDALECSFEEEQLSEWLDERGVQDPWDVAPALVPYGWGVERVEGLEKTYPGEAFAPVLRWLAAGLAAQALLGEIRTSAEAISGIVRAVKNFSYLDQAPVQEVDVRGSLEDTLVMLRHELKGGVQVRRDFAPDLPPIQAYAPELNQVWMNLIDNAIDAMDGKGTLELAAVQVGDEVEVTIADDGPGIDPAMGTRIFDPFFTTKPPGEGTGLGLHVSYNIVMDRHRGRIWFESRPGRTVFHVRLPIRLHREPS